MCPLHVTPMPSDSDVMFLITAYYKQAINHQPSIPTRFKSKLSQCLGLRGGFCFQNPYHPCMVYLPRLNIFKHQPNVGKYTIHGWYGKCHHDIPTYFVAAMRHSSSPSSKSLVAMKIMASPCRGEWKGVEYLRFEAGLHTHDFLLMCMYYMLTCDVFLFSTRHILEVLHVFDTHLSNPHPIIMID